MSHAREILFPANANAVDFVEATAGARKFLSIEGGDDAEGWLTFRSEAGAAMGVLNSPEGPVTTAANKFNIEFRTQGRVTFATFLRSQGDGSDAYMVFLAISEKSTTLYLCKTTVSSTQQPSQTALATKSVSFIPEGWCTLEVELQDGNGQLNLSAALHEVSTGQTVIEISALDQEKAIETPGEIAFRFFADKSQGGGSVQIKRIVVEP